MMNLKNKHIVVVDNGLAMHLAETLSESYGKVSLYIPHVEAFPMPDRDVIGTGIKGVDRIYDIYSLIHAHPVKGDPDIWFFPYIGFSALQTHLKDLGYRVCGSGDSDILEMDKWKFQKEVESAGLPVVKTERVEGITALKGYLKGKSDVYIKISCHRNVSETYKYRGDFLSGMWLKDVANKLGQYAESMEFLIQEKIDSICEIGMDSFNLNGKHPDYSMIGIEIKDAGYIGRIVKDQPEILRQVNSAMAPAFKKLGCNGLYSTEVRIGKDKKPYYIDGTIRMPVPPGELFPIMYQPHNYAQAIWDLSEGKMPVLKPAARYGAEIIINSEWLDDGHWLPVKYPASISRFVRLKNYCIDDKGGVYIIPNNNSGCMGGVTGLGKTPEEAWQAAVKNADQVQADCISYEHNVMDKANEQIEKLKGIGITF